MKTLFRTTILFATIFAYSQVEEIKIEDNVQIPADVPIKGSLETADDGVYAAASLQVKPEYPGGDASLINYFKANVKIPATSGLKKGTYIIQLYFIIEKDGSMTGIKAMRSPEKLLNEEVLRVASSVRKKWQPGILNGKAVRSSRTLPVEITIP